MPSLRLKWFLFIGSCWAGAEDCTDCKKLLPEVPAAAVEHLLRPLGTESTNRPCPTEARGGSGTPYRWKSEIECSGRILLDVGKESIGVIGWFKGRASMKLLGEYGSASKLIAVVPKPIGGAIYFETFLPASGHLVSRKTILPRAGNVPLERIPGQAQVSYTAFWANRKEVSNTTKKARRELVPLAFEGQSQTGNTYTLLVRGTGNSKANATWSRIPHTGETRNQSGKAVTLVPTEIVFELPEPNQLYRICIQTHGACYELFVWSSE